MGKTRAEIQKAYRERKKEKEGQSYLLKESQRVMKYYRPSSELPRRELRQRRERNNRNLQRHRDRVKVARMNILAESTMDSGIGDDLQPYSSSTPLTPLVVQLPFSRPNGTRRNGPRIRSRKKNMDKAYKKIRTLEKRCKRTEKRLERARKKSKTKSKTEATPNTKTQSEMDALASTSSESLDKVRQKLLFANVMVEEIKDARKANSRGKLKAIHQIVSGKIAKRYRLLRTINKETGLCRKTLSRVNGKDVAQALKKATYVSLCQREKERYLEFLCREDNSRMMPGKKDADKFDGEKVQRYVLNDYLNNLHAKFTSENIGIKISRATFSRMRPSYIKTVNFATRSICLCIKHQNLAMAIKCIRSEGILLSKNPEVALENLNTDEDVRDVLSELPEKDTISFQSWRKVAQPDKPDGPKKLRVADVQLSRQGFIDHVVRETAAFRIHTRRIHAQFSAMKALKEKLPPGEGIAQMDFAENFVCIPLEGIQSSYWNQEGVTIHPVLLYYRDAPGSKLRHQSFAVISNDRNHNANAIMAFMDSLIPEFNKVLPQPMKRIHYWTDSPTSQYRNKDIFSWISRHQAEYQGLTAVWNYWEAGHGKGPCDGLGGTIKRMADEAVQAGKVVIQDPFDLHAWAEQSGLNIKFIFVSEEDCKQHAEKRKSESNVEPVAVPGTMELHAVYGMGNQKIRTRVTSCYCDTCIVDIATSLQCNWTDRVVKHKKQLNPTTASARPADTVPFESSPTPSEGNAPDHLDETPVTPPEPMEDKRDEIAALEKGDIIAVRYIDNRWYLAKVLEIDFNDQDIHVRFLSAGKTPQTFAAKSYGAEEVWVYFTDYLTRVKPEPIGRSGRTLKLNNEGLNAIKERFEKLG